MGLFGALGGIISPKIAINMLRKNLEKQIGKDIGAFNIMYNRINNTLVFNVNGNQYLFEDEGIKKIVSSTAAKQLKANQTLDIILATVSEKNDCEVKMYYTEVNAGIKEQHFITQNLWQKEST